ncbi:Valyl-tRNA synthetase [Roseibacterium elongatum DSM 19469]|uniref:Valine--tRNA ligase n=1 Tax=Roseicyclus elongatus DSM 19469 TaxID=1294273 RepID=W8RSG4_9RHOB|nr:valine--tRNA ligase [Roseibacterium elongatum]AHM04124.1 Valyl-tRNA synthetase [Roseibacterium elongatum DSM 19469]
MDKSFNAAEAEARIMQEWQAKDCFKAGANAKPGADPFCIMIPPPNVTGVLHVGHAFNNTLQDVLVRWHRMRGFDTLWQPGTDHAGIATQMVVERELAKEGKSRRDMSREDFLSHVWAWKQKSGNTIREQLKRLGASCDWSREAFTMSGAPGAPQGEDGNFHDAVIKVFVDMYNKGFIYRGKRLVNWDPHFETAISDLEVENIDQQGHMWHFKYPLAGGETYTYVEKDAEGNVTLEEERDYISIATTRPETMLGDGAVAVHPDDARYAPIVGKLCEIPVGPKEHRRLIPIITDEYPDPDFGSGAVKITGAHDFNDYGVAKRGDIPCYRLMDEKAHLREDGLPYAEAAAIAQEVANGTRTLSETEADALNLVPDHLRGLERFEARKRVVAEITEEGLAVMTRADDPRLGKAAVKADDEAASHPVPLVEEKLITQPFGDRSKVVIEPMLTDQWFVDTAKIVGPALDAVRDGRTTIMPEQHRKVYFHWLENIEPWTISRQLWWGHQIPVWYGFDLGSHGFTDDEGDGQLDIVEMLRLLSAQTLLKGDERHHAAHDFEAVSNQFADVLAKLPAPLNHAQVIEVEDRHAAAHALAESLAQYNLSEDPTHLVYPVWRDADVLDTWFSSGLWPIGTLGWPEQTPELQRYFPTSVLVSGFDIIFFWVARMMMMQLAVVDEIPFKQVYVHALVRDEKGRKMSKSIGNVLDPLELVDEFGADAVRFTLTAMAAMGRDLKLSKDRVAGYRNFGTKLWNAARFAEMNDCKPVPGFDPAGVTQTVNKWIIGETARARLAHDEALSGFRFNDAANGLYAFVWGRVCDWYLEFAKPLFDSGDAAIIAETRATMAWVIDQCLILMHPTMPFVTEELWGEIAARDTMLIHADWPSYGDELIDPAADAEMTWVLSLIEEVRSVRQQMHVPAGLKVPLLQLQLDADKQAAYDANAMMIERLGRIEELRVISDMPKGAVTVAVEGGTFGLPIADYIDVEQEKERLEKVLGKLAKEIGGLKGRLSNPKFAESAPEEVVQDTRDNLAAREEEEGKIRAALERLSALG